MFHAPISNGIATYSSGLNLSFLIGLWSKAKNGNALLLAWVV